MKSREARRQEARALMMWAIIAVAVLVFLYLLMGGSPRAEIAGLGPRVARCSPGKLPRSLTGHVVSVVDGDTIDVALDSCKIRVRYIGVNTRETKHPTKGVEPCGPEAFAANLKLVEDQTVRLELDVMSGTS